MRSSVADGNIHKLLLIQLGLQAEAQSMVAAAGTAHAEVIDPAAKAPGADGVVLRVILPVLELDVFDLVARDDIGQTVELLQGVEGQIVCIVGVDDYIYGGAKRTHVGHAIKVVDRADAEVNREGIEACAVNGNRADRGLRHG